MVIESSIQKLRNCLMRTAYQIKNWRAHARALIFGNSNSFEHEGREITLLSELSALLIPANGTPLDLGVISTRVVTTAGVNYMRDDFNGATGGADITNFNYHDSGTGTNAESVSDTDLQSPAGPARVAGTQSAPASKQYRTVATIAYNSTQAITEHGLFSASTGGTLWDRSVFSAINVVNGDSIQFTYTLTINDGG